MGGMEESKAKEMLKGMTISDLLTDMVVFGHCMEKEFTDMFIHRLSAVRTRKTWPTTSFGEPSLYLALVSISARFDFRVALT